jgi:hypothetical protein
MIPLFPAGKMINRKVASVVVFDFRWLAGVFKHKEPG